MDTWAVSELIKSPSLHVLQDGPSDVNMSL